MNIAYFTSMQYLQCNPKDISNASLMQKIAPAKQVFETISKYKINNCKSQSTSNRI